MNQAFYDGLRHEPATTFVVNESISPFTGIEVSTMLYITRPPFDTMRAWLRENRTFTVKHATSGQVGIVCRVSADDASVDVGQTRTSWRWTEIESASVSSEVHLSKTMRDFVNDNINATHKHLPIITDHGEHISVNMAYVGFFTDTQQIFVDDPKGRRAYCGHGFIIDDVDLNIHQIKIIQHHAEEWRKHVNPFKVGDLVRGPGIDIGAVVSVYPQEVDGTKYYDMDVVIGDYDLPIAVHSFQFKMYVPEKTSD